VLFVLLVAALAISVGARPSFALDQRDGGRIIVVPVALDDHTATADWRSEFADWAGPVWADMTRGHVDLELDLAAPLRQWPCSGCRFDPFDTRILRPWVEALLDRHRRLTAPPDAWLLLFPPGTIEGAGAFLPARWLGGALGIDAFDLLLADGPVSAMHEIGHFLGLPDRYDPHRQPDAGALTLMGWTAEPLTPPDPLLRAARGWTELRAMPPPIGPFRKTLHPGETLRVPLSAADLWVALSSVPGAAGPDGWLVEIDRGTLGTEDYHRLAATLYGLREPGVGSTTVELDGDDRLDLRWQFIPSPPRLLLDAEPVGHWTADPPMGCGSVGAGLIWPLVLATAGLARLRQRSSCRPASVRIASVRPASGKAAG
jgi:hypothetical protein